MIWNNKNSKRLSDYVKNEIIVIKHITDYIN